MGGQHLGRRRTGRDPAARRCAVPRLQPDLARQPRRLVLRGPVHRDRWLLDDRRLLARHLPRTVLHRGHDRPRCSTRHPPRRDRRPRRRLGEVPRRGERPVRHRLGVLRRTGGRQAPDPRPYGRRDRRDHDRDPRPDREPERARGLGDTAVRRRADDDGFPVGERQHRVRERARHGGCTGRRHRHLHRRAWSHRRLPRQRHGPHRVPCEHTNPRRVRDRRQHRSPEHLGPDGSSHLQSRARPLLRLVALEAAEHADVGLRRLLRHHERRELLRLPLLRPPRRLCGRQRGAHPRARDDLGLPRSP